MLSGLGVGRLVVVGAQTDGCVRATLHGALVRGHDATLVSDAHTTEDQTAWGAPPPDLVIAHTNLYWAYETAPGRRREGDDRPKLPARREGDVVDAVHLHLAGRALCASLGLELYPGYLEDCCSVVFPTPTRTRRKISWPPALARDVERRARAFPFLDGYELKDET